MWSESALPAHRLLRHRHEQYLRFVTRFQLGVHLHYATIMLHKRPRYATRRMRRLAKVRNTKRTPRSNRDTVRLIRRTW